MPELELLLYEDEEGGHKTINFSQIGNEFKIVWVKKQSELDTHLQDDHYDLILTDIRIAGNKEKIYGYDQIQELRLERDIIRTPVIVYSADLTKLKTLKSAASDLYFDYVERKGDWTSPLYEKCMKAVNQNRILTGLTTLKSLCRSAKILNDKMSLDYFSDTPSESKPITYAEYLSTDHFSLTMNDVDWYNQIKPITHQLKEYFNPRFA